MTFINDRVRLETLESRTLLNAGDLDSTFGSNGLVFSSFPSNPFQLQATSVVVQNDGKTLAAGIGFSSSNSALLLARYMPNGTPDDSFGDHGQLVVAGNYAIGMNADLKLTTGGFVVGTGSYVLRFGTSGALDNSFSGDGIAFVGPQLISIAAESDGSVVGLRDQGQVVHVLNTGTLDPNFGTNGVVNLAALDGLTFEGGAGIAIDQNNRIITAGTAYPDDQPAKADAVITVLKSNGALDTNFNSGKGFATADFGIDQARALALAPDGKILVFDADRGPVGAQRVLRFTTAGKLDSTFNGGVAGATQPQVQGAFSIGRDGMSVQSDGKIVLASQNFFDSKSAGFVVNRMNPDGSADGGFSSDGKAFIPLGKPATEAATSPGGLSPAVAITNGKIIIAGGTLPPAKPSLFALARLQGVGATAPLATINSKGIIVVPGTSGDDRIEILLGGANTPTTRFVQVRRGNDAIDFPLSGNGIKGVSVTGGAGNDGLFMSVDLPATLRGGDGNDRVETASNTNQLYGDSGNDTVQAGSGRDVIHAGSGNDLIDEALGGGDDIFGDSGTDTVTFATRTKNLTLSLDNHANDGASGEHDNIHSDIENILGGSGNDRIIGSPFNNGLNGGAGNDTIYGGAGNDSITGGSGRDLLFGQDGNDTFFAQDGQKDSIDGGNGFDTAQRDHGSIKDQITHVESFV